MLCFTQILREKRIFFRPLGLPPEMHRRFSIAPRGPAILHEHFDRPSRPIFSFLFSLSHETCNRKMNIYVMPPLAFLFSLPHETCNRKINLRAMFHTETAGQASLLCPEHLSSGRQFIFFKRCIFFFR